MTKRTQTIWQAFLKISLWAASAGLMLASSGLDGAYLSRLMPDGWAWLGLVLNTVADVTSELGMYWYGRLRMDASSTKRKRASWILVGQVVLVGYAWLFGWRQLVPRMRIVDPAAASWMAPLAAAFIPAALVVVGFIQSLLAGRIEKERTVSEPQAKPERIEPAFEPALSFACPHCAATFDTQAGLNAHQRVHKRERSNGHGKRSEPEPQEVQTT